MIETGVDADLVLAEREAWLSECQAVYRHARTLLSSFETVVVDVETSGLDEQSEIIELTIIDCSGMVLIDSLVRPRNPIPPKITELTGISDADVAGAPTIVELWPAVKAVLDGSILTAYNCIFDVRQLFQEMVRHSLPWPSVSASWCVMQASQVALCNGDRSMRWPRLSAACERLGVAEVPGHRALADCRATLGVLRKLAERAN